MCMNEVISFYMKNENYKGPRVSPKEVLQTQNQNANSDLSGPKSVFDAFWKSSNGYSLFSPSKTWVGIWCTQMIKTEHLRPFRELFVFSNEHLFV